MILDAYKEANNHKASLMEDAILIAYAVMSIQGRVDDEVSASEAYRLYDRGWIIDRTNRGMIHFSRKGPSSNSARIYSRFEIEALKRAEKRVSEAFEEAERRSKELKNLLDNEIMKTDKLKDVTSETDDIMQDAVFSIEETERELIKKALKKNGGNRKCAAADLGFSERTIYRKMKEYNL